MVVIGIFFFTAFLALFAVAATGLAFRVWWLRRKLRESMETPEAEYRSSKMRKLVEETKDKEKEANET